ncbi:hypothetical protein KEM52_001383 [Ascosphaera acerosa]|nr:hypothetical protein KEM52_001383 [Ascosphaera acerosa]
MFKCNSISQFFRIPRPATFLYVLSLQTGASLIVLSLLLNKISGVYGILAILTGYHISLFQLSMYIYSLLALCLTAFLSPYIRTQAPLQCLALAWFYVLDSLINTAYTVAFGASWFLVVSQHHLAAAASASVEKSPSALAPGAGMLEDTAGFTNPKYNASSVAIGTGANGVSALPQQADAPAGMDLSAAGSLPTVANGMRQPEGFQSVVIIVALLAVRVYFSCVMLAFARQCIQQYNSFECGYAPAPLSQSRGHSRTSSAASSASATGSLPFHSTPSHARSHSSHSVRSTTSQLGHARSHSHRRNLSLISRDEPADPNPFSPRRPEGQGWKGQLGRVLIMPARSFFLSSPEFDDDIYGGGSATATGRVGQPGLYDPDLDNTWMTALNRKQLSSQNPSDIPYAVDLGSPASAGPSRTNAPPSKKGASVSITSLDAAPVMDSSTSQQRNKLPKLKSKGLPGFSGQRINNSLPNSPFNFTFPAVTSPSPGASAGARDDSNERGVSERERRRRSGTGPPPPSLHPSATSLAAEVDGDSLDPASLSSPVTGVSRTPTPLGLNNRSATPGASGGPRGRSTPRPPNAKGGSPHSHSMSTGS